MLEQRERAERAAILAARGELPAQPLVTFNQRLLLRQADVETPSAWNEAIIYSCPKDQCGALEVRLQRAFRGPRHVLTSEVASIPCSELGVTGLLQQMNFYSMTTFRLSSARRSLLETALLHASDFGVAYSLLRPRWNRSPGPAADSIRTCFTTDDTARRNALDGDSVRDKLAWPRRLWDLWSNRVVPTWMVHCTGLTHWYGFEQSRHEQYLAVSHAWLDERDRQVVDTPINGYEWPVPIPPQHDLGAHTHRAAPSYH